MALKSKEIAYSIDESRDSFKRIGACHYCTSHKGDRYPLATYKGRTQAISRIVYSKKYLNGENIPKGKIVRHKCDNTFCINPEHLELGTQLDNVRDCIERGRFHNQIGKRNGFRKLNDKIVEEIFYSKGSSKKISEEYNISISQVSKIRRGESWWCVTNKLERPKWRRGKIDKNIIIDIFTSKLSAYEIRDKYNISLPHIYLIRMGKRCGRITKGLVLNSN